MMKRVLATLAVVAVMGIVAPSAIAATYAVTFDFETSWGGDYAPGWENSDYRHGEAPVGKMMQQITGGYNSANAMQLIADSVPQDWMWWAIVNPIDVNETAMQKEYNPYLKAMWYDEGTEGVAGQIYAVPNWVNLYLDGDAGPDTEDWTDVQFGGRFNHSDNYYYVAVGEGHPGWQDSGTARTGDWHELKMQLLSTDGKIHFSVDGTEVGSSYRSDYADLLGVSLATMFQDPLSGWDEGKPYTIWDNVEFGSDYVPEPATLLIWSLLGALGGVACWWRRK
ncbi:MAG: PEP-CTERM sorting domain-containing protein [Planctomycetia bacterium]|nr:PEP-CTERM sorting domain-containing protein [Planctomycetia bacterium]